MSELARWFDARRPFDLLERRTPFELLERLFEGDAATTAAIKVEEVIDEGTLVIRAELPGIDPTKDVDVSISDGSLHIEAHREEKKEQKAKGGYRSEFRYGSFARTLRLPEGVTQDDVTATYKNGVLEVRVPLPKEPEEPAPKRSKIEVKPG